MPEDQDHGAIPVFGRCLLCENEEESPVATCCRCGAFVCRRHVVKLVYHSRPKPVGIMTPNRQKGGRRLEMVCEVCYLNELVAREEAV